MNEELEQAARTGRIDDFFGAGNATLSRLAVPDGVEEVGQGAFSRMPHLVSLHLPDSVGIIGASAFQDCPLLEEIRIPSGIREIRGAFSATPRLVRIHVEKDSGLRLEGAMLLKGNILLRVFASLLQDRHLLIPAGVVQIAGGALSGCIGLETVSLPDGLQAIGGGAFAGCRDLAAVELPRMLLRIGGNAFFGDSALAEMSIPDSVEELGEWCFDGCDSLRRAAIPEKLRCPANAFPPSCRVERRNPFPGGTETPVGLLLWLSRQFVLTHTWKSPVVPPYAFAELPSLEEVVLPESVEEIGDGAFQSCPCLRAIHLPEGLKLLGRNAFASLPLLEEINLPDGIAEIPQGCFWNCTALRRVKLPASLRTINRHAFRDCRMLEAIEFPGHLSNIVSGAFLGCSSLRNVQLPESVELVGSGDYLTSRGDFPGAFENCTSLVDVQLPTELDLLNDRTFSGCTALRHVRMPESIRRLGKEVFSGCPGHIAFTSASSSGGALPDWLAELARIRAPKLGFLFALAQEAEPFARRFGVAGNLVPHRVFTAGGHCLLVCGAGRANAAAGTIRLAREGCQVVVNIGLCGGQGLSREPRVFAPRVCWDGDAYARNPGEALLDPAGVNEGRQGGDDAPPLFTVSGFAEDPVAPCPVLVDNEGYAIAAAAGALGIRRFFFKIVSDCADGHAMADFRTALHTVGDHVDTVGKMLLAELGGTPAGEDKP